MRRLYPLTASETHVVFDVFFHPAAFSADFDPQDVVGFWQRANDEDREVCERQQIGMRSRGYVPSRYAAVEDGVHAFDCMVARSYLP